MLIGAGPGGRAYFANPQQSRVTPTSARKPTNAKISARRFKRRPKTPKRPSEGKRNALAPAVSQSVIEGRRLVSTRPDRDRHITPHLRRGLCRGNLIQKHAGSRNRCCGSDAAIAGRKGRACIIICAKEIQRQRRRQRQRQRQSQSRGSSFTPASLSRPVLPGAERARLETVTEVAVLFQERLVQHTQWPLGWCLSLPHGTQLGFQKRVHSHPPPAHHLWPTGSQLPCGFRQRRSAAADRQA